MSLGPVHHELAQTRARLDWGWNYNRGDGFPAGHGGRGAVGVVRWIR